MLINSYHCCSCDCGWCRGVVVVLKAKEDSLKAVWRKTVKTGLRAYVNAALRLDLEHMNEELIIEDGGGA